jgi:hypothetical protein
MSPQTYQIIAGSSAFDAQTVTALEGRVAARSRRVQDFSPLEAYPTLAQAAEQAASRAKLSSLMHICYEQRVVYTSQLMTVKR